MSEANSTKSAPPQASGHPADPREGSPLTARSYGESPPPTASPPASMQSQGSTGAGGVASPKLCSDEGDDSSPTIGSIAAPRRYSVFHPHPGVELRANLKSISHRCRLFGVAFVWELTKETINLPLGLSPGRFSSSL